MPLLHYGWNLANVHTIMISAEHKYCMNMIEYSSVFLLVVIGFSKQCPFMHAAFFIILSKYFRLVVSRIYNMVRRVWNFGIPCVK